MNAIPRVIAASAAGFALLGVALAQDSSMEGHDMAADALPQACGTEKPASGDQAMAGMAGMDSMMAGAGDAQKALMEGMMRTQGQMMQGVMAADPDIAFVCGMIPHHQAAIDMAQVELRYGDSAWAKEMAEKIIAAQETEIAEMKKWLDEQPK